ncbi:DUF1289 domain-containing protein [Tepidimonas alkaliphilus]|uniref:DUF1289 domain-containing protein n=1 Tax=Tepidimonas alkaliphilus TaxID=2588942 RepID=UPI001FE68BE6|nr:DUF1289 domain-containing protein [Tepidimonas alkaliphilus]
MTTAREPAAPQAGSHPAADSQPVTLEAARRRRPDQGLWPSPCVGVCRLDEARGWCAGCWRTLEEITVWRSADDATRQRIWAALEARQRLATSASR